MNKAIILAAYGSRHKNAVAALSHIEEHVREAHPGVAVRLAYTSKVMRGHMRKGGDEADSVAQALDKLLDSGIKRAVIQSLHIIPGMEFHDLLMLANKRMLDEGGFTRLEVGFPLVAGEEGLDRVAKAILSIVPKPKDKTEAVLLMGHGTLHPGNAYYEALNERLQAEEANVFVGAMEAGAGIDHFSNLFAELGIKKAYLLPFLFGAGWHAAQDMVGDGDGSWKSVLETRGIHCEPVLKGAGEFDELVDIWLGHLGDAMRRLDRDAQGE